MVKINLKKGLDLRKFDPPNKPKFNLEKKPKINLEKKPEPPRRELRDSQPPWIPKIEKPQEGLEPILGNFYGSPPIDPRDCEIYPDSPWCGGNPLSLKPISYDFSIVQDECNLGVQLNAELAFIKLPPVQIVYRNPECQLNFDPPPDKNYEELPEVPERTSEVGVYAYYVPYRLEYDEGGTNQQVSKLASGIAYTEVYTQIAKAKYSRNEFLGNIDGFNYDLIIEIDAQRIQYQNMVHLYHSLGGKPSEEFTQRIEELGMDFKGDISEPNTTLEGDMQCKMICYWNMPSGSRLVKYNPDNEFFRNHIPIPQVLGENAYPEIVTGLKSYFNLDIQRNGNWFVKDPDDIEPQVLSKYFSRELKIEGRGTDIYGSYYYGKEYLVYAYSKKYKIIWIDSFERLPPPLPPPMSCCPKTRENDELLRLIAKRLGAYDYPVSVPKIFTDRSKGTESIENLTRLHTWQAKQLDALCGKYPIEVKIKDSDLTKQGDQPTTLKLPNIAEALAELLGLILLLKAESGATLSASVRAMIEAGSGKQAAILAYDYAKANAEFLGYSGKQVKRKVPFAFNFNKQKLDEMLKEGEFEIKGFDNDDKDDLKDTIMPLLDMAAMYKSANFRKIDAKDPGAGLKTILDGYNAFASLTKQNIDEPKAKKEKEDRESNPNQKNNPESWDGFLENAEKGFIAEPGIKNNTEPYDRPFDQRPKIREIGNDTSTLDTKD